MRTESDNLAGQSTDPGNGIDSAIRGNAATPKTGAGRPSLPPVSPAFLDRLIAEFGWQEPKAERNLLLKCLPFWKRPLWILVETLVPSAFKHDREVIRDAGKATTMSEVAEAVDLLHYHGRFKSSFWRNSFGLRVSGRRLFELAKAHIPKRGLE
jgi:hypothetical protein